MKKLLFILAFIPTLLAGQYVIDMSGYYNPANKIEGLYTLTSTGNGTGVSTLTMTVSSATTVTLASPAKFYSDAGGTADESSTWDITTGAARTIYLKCPSGSSGLSIADRYAVTEWNAWTSGANAASLSGRLESLPLLTYVSLDGTHTIDYWLLYLGTWHDDATWKDNETWID